MKEVTDYLANYLARAKECREMAERSLPFSRSATSSPPLMAFAVTLPMGPSSEPAA
jgi:hypothetical protein